MIGGAKSKGKQPKNKYSGMPTTNSKKRRGQKSYDKQHMPYEEFKDLDRPTIPDTLRKPDAVVVNRRGLPGGGSSGFVKDAKEYERVERCTARRAKLAQRKAKRASPEYQMKLEEKVTRRLEAKAKRRAA